MHLGLIDTASDPHYPGAISVESNWDFIQLELNEIHAGKQSAIEEVLSNIPGIGSFNRMLAYPLSDFDNIVALTKAVYAERLRGKTFVVRCRRIGTHAYSSPDVERYVGAGLLQQTAAKGVNLHHPEITVAIEIRQQELYVLDERKSGIGGFPLGTQDSVISLLSGGFDSAVTSYLAMKRGLRTHFLFFNLAGLEHEIAVKEVAFYLWSRFGASHTAHFITVPFEGVVAEMLEKVENSQMGVILKRMMLRAATKIVDELELHALVTGESMAQVSSQTLVNLAVIDIRHAGEEERRPLQVLLATVKTIPFYKLNNAFALLPVTTQYFLYCEKDVMSQLHASFLAGQGYTNIGVYRPEKNSIPVSG